MVEGTGRQNYIAYYEGQFIKAVKSFIIYTLQGNLYIFLSPNASDGSFTRTLDLELVG